MELIAPKKFEENYSLPTLEVLEAMSMTGMKTMKIEGSSGIRSQLYAGDFDGSETVKASSCKEIADHLQMIVKKLRSLPNVVIGDIKVGEVPEWNVFRPSARVENNKIEDFNIKDSQSKVDTLREENVITAGEAKHANELLEKADTEWDFLHARKSIRYHILRWTPREILEGAKFVRGNNIVKLEDAVASGGMIKLDSVANIHDRFVEFSVIYNVYVKGKRITPALPPIVRSLLEDMLYYQKINPFKAIKRLFSLIKYEKDYASAEKLIPILNGDLGRLYQIIGDLKTLEMLLENRKRPTAQIKQIRAEIDEVRQRLGNIYQLKDLLKAEHTLIGSIITMLKTPIPKLQAKLGAFIDQLQKILTQGTLEQAGDLLKQRTGGGKWTDSSAKYVADIKKAHPNLPANKLRQIESLQKQLKEEFVRLTEQYPNIWNKSERESRKEQFYYIFVADVKRILGMTTVTPEEEEAARKYAEEILAQRSASQIAAVRREQERKEAYEQARLKRQEAAEAANNAMIQFLAEKQRKRLEAERLTKPEVNTFEQIKNALLEYMRTHTDDEIKEMVSKKNTSQKQTQMVFAEDIITDMEKTINLPRVLRRFFSEPTTVNVSSGGGNRHAITVYYNQDKNTIYINDALGHDRYYKWLKNRINFWNTHRDTGRISINENSTRYQMPGTWTCPHWSHFHKKMFKFGEDHPRLAQDLLNAIKAEEFHGRKYPEDWDDFIMIYGCIRGDGKKIGGSRDGLKAVIDRVGKMGNYTKQGYSALRNVIDAWEGETGKKINQKQDIELRNIFERFEYALKQIGGTRDARYPDYLENRADKAALVRGLARDVNTYLKGSSIPQYVISADARDPITLEAPKHGALMVDYLDNRSKGNFIHASSYEELRANPDRNISERDPLTRQRFGRVEYYQGLVEGQPAPPPIGSQIDTTEPTSAIYRTIFKPIVDYAKTFRNRVRPYDPEAPVPIPQVRRPSAPPPTTLNEFVLENPLQRGEGKKARRVGKKRQRKA
jgi:hypothetical protein